LKIVISLVLAFSLSMSTFASPYNATITTEKADVSENIIARLYGRWEGNIDYQYFENAAIKHKYTRPFRIEITPNSIEFFNKNDAGEWIKTKPSYVNSFKFKMDKDTLSGYFFNSGNDEDGLWVESQSMYITLKDDHTILIYSIRSVNNTGIKDATSGTKWMEMGAGELAKSI
jgi:hypothetical protein